MLKPSGPRHCTESPELSWMSLLRTVMSREVGCTTTPCESWLPELFTKPWMWLFSMTAPVAPLYVVTPAPSVPWCISELATVEPRTSPWKVTA